MKPQNNLSPMLKIYPEACTCDFSITNIVGCSIVRRTSAIKVGDILTLNVFYSKIRFR